MPISHEALFKVALNLEDPWYITSMDFSVEGRQLDIHVDYLGSAEGHEYPDLQVGDEVNPRPVFIFS